MNTWIFCLALTMTVVIYAQAPADIFRLPCRDPMNFDPSSCLFADDYCDFNAKFSLFYDQATPYYKYVQNPLPEQAEFVIESGAPRVQNDTLVLSLIPPISPATTGVATIVSTTRFLHYGLFEARMKVSGRSGTVTSFIGFSNLHDELDVEITGYDNVSVQANWYYRGLADVFPSNGSSVNGYIATTNLSTSEFYQTYTVNWTMDSISWFIDGRLVHRSTNKTDGKKGFPDTPMRISFGIWQAQENSTWAGPSMITDWSEPISTTFQSLRVSCLAGPHHNNQSGAGDQLTHPSTGYDPDYPHGVPSPDPPANNPSSTSSSLPLHGMSLNVIIMILALMALSI